jgi:hypothetical protein
MKRALIATSIVAALFAAIVTVSTAEEKPQPAPAAQQDAPAANSDKAVEATGGCMPGGGCCGQGACAQAAAAAEKGAADDSAGGCPCMKNKKAKR